MLDPAGVHHHDTVGDLHRLFLVVRDDHGRGVRLVVQTAEPDPQLLAHARVECAERFVEQQHLRIDCERARQTHALPLAAGELGRIPLRETAELDEVEQLGHALLDLTARTPADRQPEGDVVPHRHVLEGCVVLKDEADAACLGLPLRDVLTVEQHLARIRPLEPRDHPEQSRLAAAARPEQRRERPGRHVDGNAVESREVPEALDDSASLDHCAPSLGLSWVMSSKVEMASSANTTAAA